MFALSGLHTCYTAVDLDRHLLICVLPPVKWKLHRCTQANRAAQMSLFLCRAPSSVVSTRGQTAFIQILHQSAGFNGKVKGRRVASWELLERFNATTTSVNWVTGKESTAMETHYLHGNCSVDTAITSSSRQISPDACLLYAGFIMKYCKSRSLFQWLTAIVVHLVFFFILCNKTSLLNSTSLYSTHLCEVSCETSFEWSERSVASLHFRKKACLPPDGCQFESWPTGRSRVSTATAAPQQPASEDALHQDEFIHHSAALLGAVQCALRREHCLER